VGAGGMLTDLAVSLKPMPFRAHEGSDFGSHSFRSRAPLWHLALQPNGYFLYSFPPSLFFGGVALTRRPFGDAPQIVLRKRRTQFQLGHLSPIPNETWPRRTLNASWSSIAVVTLHFRRAGRGIPLHARPLAGQLIF